jgi:hypothetical protein
MKIDKGIPIPNRWPFAEMKPGDSFAIPEGFQRQSVAVAAMRYGKKHKMKFSTRKMPDNTYRCWRTE